MTTANTKAIDSFKKVHYNVPQLLFSLVFAQTSYLIWGRSTGKTEGPGAYFTIRNLYDMPRSNGLIVGVTYVRLWSNVLPALQYSWERMGYFENVHYWLRQYAPDKLRLDKAWRHPEVPQHYIHWHNGSGIYLASLDRPSLINGVRSQWQYIDEAKDINKKRYDNDVYPTLTGHLDLYGHLSNYRSRLFTTDMPTTANAKWLLDAKEMMDTEEIECILNIQIAIMKLQEKYFDSPLNQKLNFRNELKKKFDELNSVRKGSVYFSLASMLDNVHATGIEAIKDFKRTMSDLDFRVRILNQQIIKIEKGFYGLLDPDVHGYDAANYHYIDSLKLGYKDSDAQDCRWDKDLNQNLPLEIACDANNAINCIVTGQEYMNTFWLQSSKFVLWPNLLDACIELWHEYYKYHPVKEVIYYFDATSKKGNARSDISESDEWTSELTKLGWHVTKIDIGQIGSHNSRYHFWGRLLQGKDPRLPKFFYNKTNASAWELSAQQAGIVKTGDKYNKDKRSEKPDSGVPPEEATHLSEAADILLWGKYRNRFNSESDYIGLVSS